MWQVTDNADRYAKGLDDTFTFKVMRDRETAAVCWDYGLACVIEATLNLRDDTVEQMRPANWLMHTYMRWRLRHPRHLDPQIEAAFKDWTR